MNWSIVISLIQNIAILLAFAMLYEYFWLTSSKNKTFFRKLLIGFVISGICLILMLTPGILVPGIVFDTRSVIISITGLFFGLVPTIITMIVAAIYRIFLGGDGMYMGLAVILTSGIIGLMWRQFRKNWKQKHFLRELLALGLIVHLIMLACTVFLPADKIFHTIKNISIPLVFIYIPATVLLGWFMLRQEINYHNRKVNQKLAESERRFTELLKNVQMVSIMLNRNGILIFCNDYFLKLTGYTTGEVIGKNWTDLFIPAEQKSKVRRLIEKLILTGHFEEFVVTKDKQLLSISWSSVLLKDESNKIVGIASIGENITERKVYEEKLLEAKERAEESGRLKTIFLANMSHEIRTPLNAIVGFSELLTDADITDSQKLEFKDIIVASSNKLLNIISDVLDVSKLETKQFKILKSKFNLDTLIYNTFEVFKKSDLSASKPNIRFIYSYPEYLHGAEIISDENRIQQVLDNLITNAFKYSNEGEIEFGVELKPNDKTNYLEFFVRDTGIGIPEDKTQMVFEQFRQVEEDTYHQGAGIGLSICKGIVELLNGEIWFDSALGKGTVFYFTIPCDQVNIAITEKKSTKHIRLQAMKKKIIIAEDDRNSFFYLNALLKAYQMDIRHAINGEVLMDMLQDDVPDLVLLDLNMPVKSGFECLEEIKQKGIKTRIIAQTAFAGQDDREKCITAGCDEYISKPVRRDELFTVLNKMFAD